MGVVFRKLSPVPTCSRLFFTFFLIRYSVSGFMLIQLDLRAINTWIYLHCSTLRHPFRLAPFTKDACFFSSYGFSSFVQNQVSISIWVYFWVFDSILFINLSGYMAIVYSFYYNYIVLQLEIREGGTFRGDTSGS